jgi:hypothetical protein
MTDVHDIEAVVRKGGTFPEITDDKFEVARLVLQSIPSVHYDQYVNMLNLDGEDLVYLYQYQQSRHEETPAPSLEA